MTAPAKKTSPPRLHREPLAVPAQGGKRPVRRRTVNVPLLLGSVASLAALALLSLALLKYQRGRLVDSLLTRGEALAEEGEWARAAGYLQQYLWVKPEDFQARTKFLDVVEKSLAVPADKQRFVGMLYESIGLAPDPFPLRKKLTKYLLELGDFQAARREAQSILKDLGVAGDASLRSDAERVLAISSAAVAKETQPVDGEGLKLGLLHVKDAAMMVEKSLPNHPGDLQLASVAALLYRSYPKQLDVAGKSATTRADEIIDRLVAARPGDAEALLVRARYRSSYGLAGAEADLKKSLELAPENYEAMILAASSALISDRDRAVELLEQAIKVRPKDVRAWLMLSQVQQQQNRQEDALATLRAGAEALGADHLDLCHAMATLLLDTGNLDEAKAELQHFDDAINAQLGRLNPQQRQSFQEQARLLEARICVARKDWGGAMAPLRAIVFAGESANRKTASPETGKALALLATVMGRLGAWDAAAGYWMQLSAAEQLGVQGYRMAATACYHARNLDQAREFLATYLSLAEKSGSPPAAEAWALLPQILLQQQLRLLPAERNWTEFQAALKNARAALPDRWEPAIVEATFYRVDGTAMSRKLALDLLDAESRKHSQDGEFWHAAAELYASLGELPRALEAVQAWRRFGADATDAAILQAALLTQDDRHEEAIQLLGEVDQAKPALRLLQARMRAYAAARRTAEALACAAETIALAPRDGRVLAAAIETAWAADERSKAEQWTAQLRQIDWPDGSLWRQYRALALLDRYEQLTDDERNELGLLIQELRSIRPSWHVSAALAARYAELRGDRREAIDGYLFARTLGDQGFANLKSLVTLLYAEGRFQEADDLMQRLISVGHGRTEIEALAISSAMQQMQADKAINLARQATRQRPNDPLARLWLGAVLALAGRSEESLVAYREGVEAFPGDMQLRAGLLQALLRNKRTDEARQVLETWATGDAVPSPREGMLLAEGFARLGDVRRAIDHCQAVVKKHPHDLAPLMLLGRLQASVDVAQARTTLEQVLAKDPRHGEARRQLAAVLASSGNDEDLRRAIQLIDESEPTGAADGAANERMRVVFLMRTGRSPQARLDALKDAQQRIESLIDRSADAVADVDRLLLARILEQEAVFSDDPSFLTSAREQFRRLIGRPEVSLASWRQYVDFVVRQLNASRRLAEEGSPSSLRELLEEDARRGAADLAERAQGAGSGVAALSATASQTRLLTAVGDEQAAAEVADQFAASRREGLETEIGQEQAWISLGDLYSQIGCADQAVQWRKKLVAKDSRHQLLLVRELALHDRVDEAIVECLDAPASAFPSEVRRATVVAQLMSAAEASQVDSRAADVVARALREHSDDVDLLLAAAVLEVARGEEDRAVTLLKRIVKLDPDHMLALNNLSTLLAEKPEGLAEALQLIQHAIEIGGREPALLDTKGAILVLCGKTEEAINDLEEATALGEQDPRYHFHLAGAYFAANQAAKATVALQTARRLGLNEAILTAGDRRQLERLTAMLLGSSAS